MKKIAKISKILQQTWFSIADIQIKDGNNTKRYQRSNPVHKKHNHNA